MKRICMIVLAAVLAAAMLAGCSGKHVAPDENNKTSSPAATAVPGNTPHAANPDDFDNSVSVTDGKVEGSAFNWLYFKGKSGAGREAEIEINSTTNGQTSSFTLTGGAGVFALDGDLGDAQYSYLLTFTADFPDDPDIASGEISGILIFVPTVAFVQAMFGFRRRSVFCVTCPRSANISFSDS